MKSVISKFVKNIVIEEYFSILKPFNKVNDVRALSGYFKEKNINSFHGSKLNGFPRLNFRRIKLKEHAFHRWNERVSRCLTNKDILEVKINLLFSHFGRVELEQNGIGIIDKEIIFTYEINGSDIIITTFYGRLSQMPVLHQFEALRNYNVHFDEYVGLELSDEVLSTLPEPPVPAQRMLFRGNTSVYLLDKFTDESSSDFFVLTVVDGPDRGVVREFYSDQPNCDKLEKSVRRALLLMGHDDFVYRHVEIHHSAELMKQINRLKERM